MSIMPLPSELTEDSADGVEAAYYEAMRHGDLEALMACWSDEDDVICVHPGGPRVVGSTAIRDAFALIFDRGAIHAVPARVRRVESQASAVHNVLEEIELMTDAGIIRAYVLSTNVYHRTARGWRMVAHHASAGTSQPPLEVQAPQPVLH